METSRLAFLDRLHERGLIDQWGFALFALVGSIAIVIAKLLAVPAVWTALGAIAVMLLYAGLIARYGSGRLQSDQAGDNCYYLGLIYTLASLAYAIFTFDPANTATTIVQGFGIALATTIFGLVLRVVFNQGRPDLNEVESSARHELIDAVTRLKTELGQSALLIGDFGRQVRQSISETAESTTKDVSKFAETSMTDFRKIVEEVQAAFVTEASGFTARTKRQAAVVDKLVVSLERHAESLDSYSQSQAAITDSLNDLRSAAAQSHATAELLAKETATLASALHGLTDTATGLSGSVRTLNNTTEGVSGAVERAHSRILEGIDQLRVAPSVTVKEAIEGLTRASVALQGELSRLGRLQEEVARSIGEQSSATTASIRAHNEALEAELGRSRAMVSTVHSNLVDMTGELAAQVGARS